MGPSRRPIAALVVAVLTAAGTAAAQTLPSIDARTWRPSADPESSLVSEPVATPGPWQWNVGAWAHYALDPLVLRDPKTGIVTSRPVEHLVGADLVAGIGLGSRLAVGADVPALVWQNGSSPLPPTVVGPGSLPKSGLGDVSLLGKATIVSNDRDGLRLGFGLAALAGVSLPTGNRSSFLGEGQATVTLRLLAEYGLGVGALRAALGYVARPESRQWPQGATGGATFGNAIPWSVGLTLRPRAISQGVDTGDRQIWEIAA